MQSREKKIAFYASTAESRIHCGAFDCIGLRSVNADIH
jgi:hypothetical protein